MTITIQSIPYKNALLYCVIGMCFLYTTFGYTQTVTDTTVASQHFTKADVLLNDRKLDSAVVYFKKALPIYQKANAWERVARCYNKIAESQWRNATYDESYKNAQKVLEISKIYLPEDNREKASAYGNIGEYYESNNSDYKTALDYYEKGLKIRTRIYAKDHPAIANSYSRIGYMYYVKKDYNKAMKYQEKALDMRIKAFGENHLDIAYSYILIGNIFFMHRKYDKALWYYQKSLIIREEQLGGYDLRTAMSYFNIGLTYDIKEEYDKALPYFDQALSIRINILDRNHKDIAICYRVIGLAYKNQGAYDKALPYFEKYLSVAVNGNEKASIVTALNYMGLIYKNRGEYKKALYYYNQAININGSKKYTHAVYNNVGVVYKDKGAYDKALKYYKKALHANVERRGDNRTHIALNYNNIGNVYRLKEEYDQSLEYYKKALAIRTKLFDQNNSNVAESYSDIGELYSLKKEYDKALNYADKALKIRIAIYGISNPFVADSYESNGNIYHAKTDYNIALEHYQKALAIRQHVFGEHHPKVAQSYTKIAKVYATQKEFASSLTYYNKAIAANIKPDTQTKATFTSEHYLNLDVLLSSLLGKAKTYTALYTESNDINDLNDAIQTYQKADALIHTIRETYTNYQDKVRFAQKAAAVYQGAIATQLLVYDTKKEQSSLEQAFYYAEKSKANTLKELLTDANAKTYTGLPADLVALEKELRIDKAFYQSKITELYSGSRMSTKDSLKMVRYENTLFDISNRQDSLTAVLEQNYPKYYQLKHENTLVTVRDIQRHLNDNTTVLEFFTSDRITYAFTISKDKITVQELATPNLTTTIEQLRKAIASQNLAAYKTTAYALYNRLISPIANTLRQGDTFADDELIIIPDGPLWHLNFELLLTQKDTTNNPADLSYLLKEYAITYANAANLLFAKDKSEQLTQQRQECLAFSFSDSTITTNTMSLAALRSTGIDLPGTRKEIKAISNIIDGQYYYGSQAIEANFKKNAGRYAILHLALHGDVDNERPENSRLYFTKSKNTIEDNLLYSHELFALDIPAELTVLSACYTGTGKIAKGEGIMSLGSAFQYAGTKSLLLSSWEVSDQTTPELMQYFYTNLKAGMNKAKALQQAKLQYLATANINRTQPFYWGGFYLVGDSSPIVFESNTLWYWVALIVLVLIGVGVFWYRRRSRV
ncbi:CHAT domain-containing protein [Aquimarina sp. EL_43]|uniref:CHAT domain-containing protein n=1 Tax=unclassified Aquimarina TaxID=2627091 RepID=UPI0018CAD4A6|nr:MULTISPECIES: CHAT domain-containing protein [unclassified Aquimarina]MBG6132257.1 CHAT domain-containing protein [Aquimarina sp. EL_35]MBG6153741.1 CHAT domain-containing protein [Aquimarina sp. EL_32]MBG6171897.1 CHAT domain-containing protein [Aquimarina sp. EL_43]